MSSILRRGKRLQQRARLKEIKKRKKEMFKILHELDEVAIKMVGSDVIIHEGNVIEEAEKYTDLQIGDFEKFILLGKTSQFYEAVEQRQNEKKNEA